MSDFKGRHFRGRLCSGRFTETAGREICAADPSDGFAATAEYEDFGVKVPARVRPAQPTDRGKHSERKGIGQVAPTAHDGPHIRRRTVPLQGAEAVVAGGPGGGKIDFGRPGEMLHEAGQYVVFGNQHGGCLDFLSGTDATSRVCDGVAGFPVSARFGARPMRGGTPTPCRLCGIRPGRDRYAPRTGVGLHFCGRRAPSTDGSCPSRAPIPGAVDNSVYLHSRLAYGPLVWARPRNAARERLRTARPAIAERRGREPGAPGGVTTWFSVA